MKLPRLALLWLLLTGGASALPVMEGPWSGAVTSETATVVARIVQPRFASLEVSPERDFARWETFPAQRTMDGAPAGLVRFYATRLQPDTLYHYRIRAGNERDSLFTGTFRTFPHPGRATSFRFAFGSCASTGSDHAVFAEIGYQQPAFFLHTGDLHYEDIAVNDPALFHAIFGRVLTASTQRHLYRHVPIAYTWDDHDYGPNNSDRLSPSRDAAQRAYRHYVPHYTLPADSALAERPLAERPVAQAFSYGRVRFILLDCRSQRDPVEQADDETKTMLGAWQRDWLKQELLASRNTHPLIFIVSSVSWISDETDRRDNWGRYTTERAALSAWMAENDVRGVCFLSGDAHMLAADDGRHNNYAGAGRPGYPALQAGPLDRRGSLKGGPWSVAPVLPEEGEGQFGLVEVNDQGDRIDVLFRGLNQHGHEKLRLAFAVEVP
jgi:phosphodiesterase/alkaline phosphatase D-like protein